MKSGPLHLPKYTLFIYLFSSLAVAIFNYSCEDKSLVESENTEFNVIEFEPVSVKKILKHLFTCIICLGFKRLT